MPQPNVGDVFVSAAIQEAAIAYRNTTFIAPVLAPVVPVTKDAGKVPVFDKADWFRDVADTDRRPGTRAPRSGYSISYLDFRLNEMAQAHPIPDRVAENADRVVRPYERGADFCMGLIMLRRERYTATKVMTTGVWGTDNTTATDWDDFSNGDPAQDILTAKRTILTNTARNPNTLVIGQIVLDALSIHPDGLDRYKHTQTGVLDLAQIAAWLGVERILVGTAARNTAAEGQTASMELIWDDDALLLYVPPSPAVDEPAACYTLQQGQVETKRYREEAEAQDVVEAMIRTEVLITGSDAGYFFSDIV